MTWPGITTLTAYPAARSFDRSARTPHYYATLRLRQPDGRGIDVQIQRILTATEVPAYAASMQADERQHIRAGADTQRWLTQADALAAAARVAELAFPEAQLAAPDAPVSFVLDPVDVVLVLTGPDPATADLIDGWSGGWHRWVWEDGLPALTANLYPAERSSPAAAQ